MTVTEKKWILKQAALVLAVSITGALPADAAVSRGRGSESAAREARTESKRNQARADLLRNQTLTLEISRRTRLSSEDLTNYFEAEAKRGALTAESKKAWNALFNRIMLARGSSASSADLLSADITAETVGAFIRLRKAGMEEPFHVTERMLLDAQEGWTIEQRSNFSRTLSRAADIAEQSIGQGKPLPNEQALEKALSEMGFLEKYRQGCRR